MFPLAGLRLSQFPPLLVCTAEDHPVLLPHLVNVTTCGASAGVVKVRLEGEPRIQSGTAVAVGVDVDVKVAVDIGVVDAAGVLGVETGVPFPAGAVEGLCCAMKGREGCLSSRPDR